MTPEEKVAEAVTGVEQEVARILQPVGLRPRPTMAMVSNDPPATAPETPAPEATQRVTLGAEPLPSLLERNFEKLYQLLEFVSLTIGERMTTNERELDKRLAEIERVLGVK